MIHAVLSSYFMADAVEFDIGPNVRFVILAILGAITSGGVISVRKKVQAATPSPETLEKLISGQNDIMASVTDIRSHLDKQDQRISVIESKLSNKGVR